MPVTLEISTLLSVSLYILIFIGLIIIHRAFRYPIDNFFRNMNPFRLNRRVSDMQDRLEELQSGIYEERANYNRRLKKLGRKLKKRRTIKPNDSRKKKKK